MTIKVIIADDHSLVRQGLRRYLEMAGDIDVVGEAANGFEVLQLLAFGHTNKDIAEQLYISPDTVKTHLEHIFEKLGTSDRTAAVAEALRRRLIE